MPDSFMNERLFAAMESSIRDINEAETLPPECYTDADFFEFEKEAIFNHEWLCVGRESWAKESGSYFTTSHIGEPLIIARTQTGELKALSAVCQHRAMLVAEGHGKVRSFLCPYHHWAYSLDGKLIGAPAMEKTCNFDMKAIHLPELKVEVWLGFVFVNFDRDAKPLAPRLRALTEALAPYDLAHADGPEFSEVAEFPSVQNYDWNWKVQYENSNDGYHANRLHHGPIHDMCPSDLSSFPEMPADTAGYIRYNGTLAQDVGFNVTRRAILPLFPGLSDENRKRFVFVNVPPTLSIFARVDYVSYSIFRADGPETMTHQRAWLVAPDAMRLPMFRELQAMTAAGSSLIGQQDRHVDLCVQKGLHSRFAPRGRYSWQEGAQSSFNQWLVTRYRQSWANGAAAQKHGN